MRSIIAVFTFICFNSFSQNEDSIQKKRINLFSVDASYSYLNYDLFHGISYTHHFPLFSTSIGLQTAVKTLYSTQKFFPETSCSFVYRLVDKHTFQFGPSLQYNMRKQKVKVWHHFNEILLGYSLFYGKRIQFSHSAGFGPFWETFKTDKNERYFIRSTNFNLKIGLSYAF
jgi:hypothetical protein